MKPTRIAASLALLGIFSVNAHADMIYTASASYETGGFSSKTVDFTWTAEFVSAPTLPFGDTSGWDSLTFTSSNVTGFGSDFLTDFSNNNPVLQNVELTLNDDEMWALEGECSTSGGFSFDSN